jgi:hypothetical protein
VTFLRALLLAALLAPAATATHEVMHVALWSMLGVPSALVVTHWRLGLAPVTVFGLHAAPLGPGGPGAPDAVRPLWQVVVNNGLGPAVAALIFGILWLSVNRRSRVARAALLANVAMLLFFSVIEVAYPLIEALGHAEADYLLVPELNYGGALAVMLATLAVSLRRRPI